MKVVLLTAEQIRYVTTCVSGCAPFLYEKDKCRLYESTLGALAAARVLDEKGRTSHEFVHRSGGVSR